MKTTPWRSWLEAVIWQHDTRAGRIFDSIIIVLIIVSVALLYFETLQGLSAGTRALLQCFETLLVLIFTVECALRIMTAPNLRQYPLNFYGLIDLLAIAPFWLSLIGRLLYDGGSEVMESLMIMRALRLLRIFRILKLAQYNAAIRRFGRAWAIAFGELLIFLVAAVLLIFIAAFLIYEFEHQTDTKQCFQSVAQSLWWAVITLTSIGYGDCVPVTTAGRVATSVIVMIGLGVVAAPAGIIASALTKVRHAEQDEKRRNK